MQPSEPAFLSIVARPERLDRNGLITALAEAAGVDPFHAGQRLAKDVMPCVIGRIDASVASDVVVELRGRGVHAIAPTSAQLRNFAPPIRAKRLVPAIGAPEPMYMCEPWRDEAFGFTAREVGIIVRARLTKTQKGPARTEQTGAFYDPFSGAVVAEYETVRDTRSSISDILDIYLRNRRRIRCCGDKFNFDMLGASRGYTDNENMDKLSVMIAESAPKAVVDLGFSDFTCPPAVASAYRTSSGGAAMKDDNPVFDFYSPWIVQVFRALAASERSGG
jgi:hypothetical protein